VAIDELAGGRMALPVGVIGVSVALAAALRAMPGPVEDGDARSGPQPALRRELLLRMAVTAALVAVLAAAARLFGPLVGGLLAGLPVLASVLAVFTHRRDGVGALVDLLRGMLIGMVGFVAFCAMVALLIVPAGTAVAFAAATALAGTLQAVASMHGPDAPGPSRIANKFNSFSRLSGSEALPRR
jgi:hypothetical protein